MVFRLAIVEDEKQDSDLLQSHIHHFFTENCPDDSFQVTVFDNAGVFIEQYRPDYDLIFLDIQWDGSGYSSAEKGQQRAAGICYEYGAVCSEGVRCKRRWIHSQTRQLL